MQKCQMHAMEVNDWLSMQVDDWLSKSAVVVTTTLPTGASPPCRGHLEGLKVPRNLAALDICISTGKHVHTLVSQGQIRVRIWVRVRVTLQVTLLVKLGLGFGLGLG